MEVLQRMLKNSSWLREKYSSSQQPFMLQTFMSLQRFMLLIQCIFFPGSYSKFGTISDELTNFQFFFFLILIGYLNASVQCKPTLLQFNTMNVLVINSLNLPNTIQHIRLLEAWVTLPQREHMSETVKDRDRHGKWFICVVFLKLKPAYSLSSFSF